MLLLLESTVSLLGRVVLRSTASLLLDSMVLLEVIIGRAVLLEDIVLPRSVGPPLE